MFGFLRRAAASLLGRTTKSAPRDNLRVRPESAAPVSVHVVGRTSLDLLRARDVSMTGLGLLVPHRFEGCDIESDVQLIITLPGRKSFKAQARVRHRSEGEENSPFFGVEFIGLNPQHRDELCSYIEERLDDHAA